MIFVKYRKFHKAPLEAAGEGMAVLRNRKIEL
jgi:hypothetical protein